MEYSEDKLYVIKLQM